MFCQKCGGEIEEGKIFCTKCGARLAPEGQKPGGAAGQAVPETSNRYEVVAPTDIYDLLKENASRCPVIKKIDFLEKRRMTAVTGIKNQYFIISFRGNNYKLAARPTFPFWIPAVILWFAVYLMVELLFDGLDFDESYSIIGWCLMIGGVLGAIVSMLICQNEKKKVLPFIYGLLPKAVCAKELVSSVAELIIYTVAALAGVLFLLVGSGAVG